MLSKSDIKKLLEVFATKQDINSLREDIATKDQYHNIIDKLDAVYKELKDFRQEQSAHAGQHEDTNKDIGDLQARINNLEQAA